MAGTCYSGQFSPEGFFLWDFPGYDKNPNPMGFFLKVWDNNRKAILLDKKTEPDLTFGKMKSSFPFQLILNYLIRFRTGLLLIWVGINIR